MATSAGVGAVFDEAAEGFTAWSADLWEPTGRALVEAAQLRAGESVLDACCGAGACALPAARAVGPEGSVVAVDLSARLVRRLAEDAAAEGLEHVRAVPGDALDPAGTPAPDPRGYDAVLCSYGVFFFPDMDAGGRCLLGRLRPGGRLAVTTWARGAIEPVFTALIGALEPELPEVAGFRQPGPLARVDSPHGLLTWLEGIGGVDVQVALRRRSVPVTADSAWTLVVGSATRSLVDRVSPAALPGVRRRFTERLPDGVPMVADTLLGTARRA